MIRRSHARRTRWWLLGTFALALCGTPRAATADPPSWLDGAIVANALHAALLHAGLGDDPTQGMATRARASGAMPQLSVRIGRGLGTSATQSLATADRATYDDSWSFDVRVGFALDRLVYANAEVNLARLRMDRAARRARLEMEVVEVLAALERCSIERQRPTATPDDRVRAVIECARQRVRLETMTGTTVDALGRVR